MRKEYLMTVFWSMVAIFLVLLSFPFVLDTFRRKVFILYAILALVFLMLGIVLIVLAARSRLPRGLKIYMIIMGASAPGVFAGSIMHNMFYAFAVMTEGNMILHVAFEIMHVGAFLGSLIVCPLLFLVGTVGALVMMHRKR